MFFNQELRVRLTSHLASLAAALAVAACSSNHALSRADQTSGAESAPQAAPAPGPAAPADSSETATEAATVSHPDNTVSASSAEPSRPLTSADLNPNAPRRYTVKRGDTLWGISSMYLRDPWLWPEIWYVNPQVANPHRIYPGDVLVLAYRSDGQPQVRLEEGGPARLEPRLRSSPLDGAIPAIPYSAIAAFLSRPAILSTSEIDHAPHVLAFRNEHQVAGEGEEAYIRGLDAPQGARFTVVHVGVQLRDPDTGRTLGYQGIYSATAVVSRPGEPAKVTLLDSARETLRGDCLFAESGTHPLVFVPRAPSTAIHGRIISAVEQDMNDDLHILGQYDIVAINRGSAQGVEAGTVLAVDQQGLVVPDWGTAGYNNWGKSDSFATHLRLPPERAGTLIVFKAYDDMSFALIVGASETMRVGDFVRNP